MRPKGRNRQKLPVDFQEILPLALKNKVSGKGDKTANVACLQEMTLLFSCFKVNEFEQAKCLNEITKFQSCYDEHRKAQLIKDEQSRTGALVPGSSVLNARQLNQLLKKFPHPK